MSASPSGLEALRVKDGELKTALARVGEMRPGSLVEAYRKCGKPGCRCTRRGAKGHGPLWMVTRQVEGKTVTKAIPAGEAVERTRQQIAEYQRFRRLTRELIETNVQLCDFQLRGRKQEAASEVKKNRTRGGVGARSRRRD